MWLKSRERTADAWRVQSSYIEAFAAGEESETFAEADLELIGDHLHSLGGESWSERPRIYAILWMMDRLHLMDDFVTAGVSDLWFPFSERALPPILMLHPDVASAFLKLQSRVQPDVVEFEQSLELGAQHFSSCDDLPFDIQARLGEGSFGEVHVIRSRRTSNLYALKRMRRGQTYAQDREVLGEFEREIAVLKKVAHRHAVKLVCSLTDLSSVGLVMSPVADENLATFLTAPRTTQRDVRLQKFYGCIATALGYLHDEQIRHKDIKPQNILIHGHNILLADFGLARDSSVSVLDATTEGRPNGLTRQYAAPEVLSWDHRSYSADIWSLGCVFLEMTTVWRGHALSELREFMMTHASESTLYSMNPNGFYEWISLVRGEATPQSPFDWVMDMLQMRRSDRPSIHSLIARITEEGTNSDYCGTCCVSNSVEEGARTMESVVEAREDPPAHHASRNADTESHTPDTLTPEASVQNDTDDYARLTKELDEASIHDLLYDMGSESSGGIRRGTASEVVASTRKSKRQIPPLSLAARGPLSTVEATRGVLSTTNLTESSPNPLNDGAQPIEPRTRPGDVEEPLTHENPSHSVEQEAGATEGYHAGLNQDKAAHTLPRPALGPKSSDAIRRLMDGVSAKDYAEAALALSGQGNMDGSWAGAKKGLPPLPPLHWAAEEGHESIVEEVLERGANINARAGRFNCTALHFALVNRQIAVAELLLKRGASTEVAAADDRRPLHYVCVDGFKAGTRLLLEAGADAEACAGHEKRPLHLAVENGNGAIVRVLLQHGVDIHAEDEKGQTAMWYATVHEHDEIEEMLLQANEG
ncbi:MAG: hypothetical protein M1838_003695 [Thelocarpon superellum]|nr:MAG: hypothetical protein M1838_003695 [Thelocarpon superellum]